jgi:hypothetical protein
VTRPPGARRWLYQYAGSLKEAGMSSTGTGSNHASGVDMNIEIDIIPVSDVDRAKKFYERLGWRFDDDAAPLEGLRIVQFTPPGSGCSITFGTGLTGAAPGSAEAGLTVSDIVVTHDERQFVASPGGHNAAPWPGLIGLPLTISYQCDITFIGDRVTVTTARRRRSR